MKWIINKDWDVLQVQYDWVADMKGVPQSPVHHAEGDVAIHTQMVLAALTGLPAYKALPEEAQEILWMAALLHDVEKRSTTFTETDGSIVSPGHAKKGALTARHILYTNSDLSFTEREQIVNLVRFHGLPLWLMHKPNPQKALLEAALHVNTEWLNLLATADILGRICEDQVEMLERIAFFEAYCQEQDCRGREFRFESTLGRFRYFQQETAVSPAYLPFDDTICEVVVLCGLPGMGKDSYIRNHYKHWPVVSPDDIRRQHKLKPNDRSANGWVAQQAKEQARVHLRSKRDFIWNATNITRQMRSQLVALFTDYNARVKLVYVERPYRIWQQQNAGREAAVPPAVLAKMLRKLEVPRLSEAQEVIYICG
jgi:predicted kinase